MISDISKGRGFRGCLEYVLGKEDALLLGGNMAGESARDLASEFGYIRGARQDVEVPVFHASLSFAKADKVTDEQKVQIAEAYLRKMGFDPDKNQFVIVQHSDKDHDHIHIVANRVGYDKSYWLDSKDYKRSMEACREIEKEYGLVQVQNYGKQEGQQLTKRDMQELEQVKAMGLDEHPKQTLARRIDAALEASNGTREDFARTLQEANVEAKFSYSHAGKIYGVSYRLDDGPEGLAAAYSGKQVGKGYEWKGIEEKLEARTQQITATLKEIEAKQEAEIAAEKSVSASTAKEEKSAELMPSTMSEQLAAFEAGIANLSQEKRAALAEIFAGYVAKTEATRQEAADQPKAVEEIAASHEQTQGPADASRAELTQNDSPRTQADNQAKPRTQTNNQAPHIVPAYSGGQPAKEKPLLNEEEQKALESHYNTRGLSLEGRERGAGSYSIEEKISRLESIIEKNTQDLNAKDITPERQAALRNLLEKHAQELNQLINKSNGVNQGLADRIKQATESNASKEAPVLKQEGEVKSFEARMEETKRKQNAAVLSNIGTQVAVNVAGMIDPKLRQAVSLAVTFINLANKASQNAINQDSLIAETYKAMNEHAFSQAVKERNEILTRHAEMRASGKYNYLEHATAFNKELRENTEAIKKVAKDFVRQFGKDSMKELVKATVKDRVSELMKQLDAEIGKAREGWSR